MILINAQKQLNGEEHAFQLKVLEKLESYIQKNESQPKPHNLEQS